MKIVLLIGLSEDIHIKAISNALEDLKISFFFFDPSEDDGIPFLKDHDCGEAILVWPDGREIRASSIASVFCRYALDNINVNQNLPDLERFAAAERLQAAFSVLRSLDSSVWINDPWLEARADCKIYQVSLAKNVGLVVPNQIISSDIKEIRRFIKMRGPAVIKSISDSSLGLVEGQYYCGRPVPSEDFQTPYTKEITLDSLALVDMDNTPSLIQSKIDRRFDIRATVIDQEVISHAIVQERQSASDFRLDEITAIEPYAMPKDISEKLVELVRRMNLRFASCDLIIDKDDELFFLEANVSGNWLFCDLRNGMHITTRIATALARDW